MPSVVTSTPTVSRAPPITSVPIRTHAATRPSRLFSSIPKFIEQTGVTILRAYTTFNSLRVFVGLGMFATLIGLFPIGRFLWFYLSGNGDGHIQSLVIGGALLTVGVLVATLGILADLIATNRKLLEANMLKLRRIEEKLAEQDKVAKKPSSEASPSQPLKKAG